MLLRLLELPEPPLDPFKRIGICPHPIDLRVAERLVNQRTAGAHLAVGGLLGELLPQGTLVDMDLRSKAARMNAHPSILATGGLTK